MSRVVIGPLQPNHQEFIFQLLNTEGWIRFIGDRKIQTLSDASAYIQKILSNEKVQYWVVSDPMTGRSMGLVTFIQRDYLKHPDIGFAFLPQFAKQGFAFEATKKVLGGLLGRHPRILATTLPHNLASIGLLKKLGFQFQEEIQAEANLLQVHALDSSQWKSRESSGL